MWIARLALLIALVAAVPLALGRGPGGPDDGLHYLCVSDDEGECGNWTPYWPAVAAVVGSERMRVIDPGSVHGRWLSWRIGVPYPAVIVVEGDGRVVDLIETCMNPVEMQREVRAAEAGRRGIHAIEGRLAADPGDTEALLALYLLQVDCRLFGSAEETRTRLREVDPEGTSRAARVFASVELIERSARALGSEDSDGATELLALADGLAALDAGERLARSLVFATVAARNLGLPEVELELYRRAWKARTPGFEEVLRHELRASPRSDELLELCAGL